MRFTPSQDTSSGGGNFLEEPGTYQAVVNAVDENPSKKSGEGLDGFKVIFAVVTGTVEGQSEKLFELMFWHPKPNQKNQGEFSRKRQTRFMLATGVIGQSQELAEDMELNLENAVGRQVIITISKEEYQGKERLGLSWFKLWHIDDPEAARHPRDEKSIALLPAEHRLDASAFKNAKRPAQPPQQAQEVDLSDI